MLKEFPSDKANVTKNAFFFLWRAPTRHNVTLNSQFLRELKRKVRLSKKVCGVFQFCFRFILIKFYIFVNKKNCGIFGFKTSYFISKLE